jgi:hypothetical protein
LPFSLRTSFMIINWDELDIGGIKVNETVAGIDESS